MQDATIAACYAQLATTALGFGSVWVGAFDDDRIRAAVAAPDCLVPVCMLAIGRPAERPKTEPRRPLDELVGFETFWQRDSERPPESRR